MMNAEYNLGVETPLKIHHIQSSCSDDTVVCLLGGVLNLSFGSSVTGTLFGGYACVLNNGSFITQYVSDPSDCLSNSGTPIFAATNQTHIWINSTGEIGTIIDMSGIVPNVTGDDVDIGFRNWKISEIKDSNDDTLINDTLLIQYNKGGSLYVDLAVSQRYSTNKVIANAYNLTTGGWRDGGLDSFNSDPGWEQWYFVSNTTHIWMNTTNELNGTIARTNGDTFSTGDGKTWVIVDVGNSEQGSDNTKFRMLINTSFYTLSMDGGNTNISISQRYGTMYGGHFCIRQAGEWNFAGMECDNQTTEIYVVANDSALWINETNSTVGSIPFYENETITNVSGKNWSITSVSGNQLSLRHSDNYVCGRAWLEQEQGEQSITILAPITSYSTIYHGYVESLRDTHMDWMGDAFNETRPVYIFHNTSMVWMSNTSNLSGVTGYTVGETMPDPYGGLWTVKAIKSNKVTLKGQNVLASTGAFVNTSLSKSGTFKIEPVRENQLGDFKRDKGGKGGLDIDGDSYTNGTFYIAISDSQSAGSYDTMFFSATDNLSITMTVNDNMSTRRFGDNDSLWFLGISAGAEQIFAYTNSTGDWSQLGDYNIIGNVSIPVMVTEPSGAATDANISIEHIRVKSTTTEKFYTLSGSVPNATISGIGEIKIENISAFGFGTGEYIFEIKSEKDGSTETLEEWKWPRATTRSFLVQTDQGNGGYASDFVTLPLRRYEWSNSKLDRRLSQDARNVSNPINGVLAWTGPFNYQDCTPPAMCGALWNINCSIMKSQWGGTDEYFIYNNESNKLFRNYSSCNLTGNEINYSIGDDINVSLDGINYTVKFLDAEIYSLTDCGGSPCWHADFGVPGINETTLPPMRNDSAQNTEFPYEWGFIHDIDLFGTTYDVVMGNDPTLAYPMIDNWNMNEYAKVAMFTANRNFTDSSIVKIGENFTDDLYLAKVGPGPWEGVIVGNFTELESLPLPSYPGVDVRVQDDTDSYFGILNESELDIDFNMDGEKNMTYYIVTYDGEEDGLGEVDRFLLDDDLNITEEWWSNNAREDTIYADFYNNETGMRESMNSLPNSIWKGNVRFGDTSNCTSWEVCPEWEIVKYNGTAMLLKKNKWNFNTTDDVTFIIRSYEFNQSAIPGAEITLERIMRMGFMGASELNEGEHYSVQNVINITNPDGYAIIRIIPNTTWPEAEYMTSFVVNYTGKIERSEVWFRVGQQEEGP